MPEIKQIAMVTAGNFITCAVAAPELQYDRSVGKGRKNPSKQFRSDEQLEQSPRACAAFALRLPNPARALTDRRKGTRFLSAPGPPVFVRRPGPARRAEDQARQSPVPRSQSSGIPQFVRAVTRWTCPRYRRFRGDFVWRKDWRPR